MIWAHFSGDRSNLTYWKDIPTGNLSYYQVPVYRGEFAQKTMNIWLYAEYYWDSIVVSSVQSVNIADGSIFSKKIKQI